MASREIQTSYEQVDCDVCGRTMLRGERTETYVDGGVRHEVCELCSGRALHEGWVREGTRLDVTPAGASDRRRSLLGRLRQRRERAESDVADDIEPDAPAPAARRAPAPRPAPPAPPREPRQVRAVPTSAEQKLSAAVDLFNASEYPRTVAGVARSLGPPVVRARTTDGRPTLVTIAVSWELSWYRFEVELADDSPTVRPAGKGYELSELDEEDLTPNASADERGQLELVAA